MEKFVSLIRMTPKAREEYRKAGDYFTEIVEIVTSFGGKLEGTWALPSGEFAFVSIGTYPDKLAGLKARTHIEALGVVTIESYPVIEMTEYLEAVAS